MYAYMYVMSGVWSSLSGGPDGGEHADQHIAHGFRLAPHATH